MRIKRIILRNYRQYKTLDLSVPKDKRLLLFIGKNGTGKSNFLNAVNWCLYDKEPFGPDVAGLPRWHKKCKKGEKVEVEVQLGDDEVTYSIQRSLGVGREDSDLGVVEKDITAKNWDPMPNPRNIVNRLLPEAVSNFFLFDGEHITNIFASKYGENIQEGINKVSQIEILDKAIKHLQTLEGSYRKQITRYLPDTKQYDDAINQMRAIITEEEDVLKKNRNDVKKLREHREKFKNKQKAISEAKSLRLECNRLEKYANGLRDDMNLCRKDINGLLYKTGPFAYIIKEMKDVKKSIDADREKGIIPPDIRPQLVKDLLDIKQCICGRKIEKGSKESVKLEGLLKKFDIADKKSFFQEGSFVIDNIVTMRIEPFSDNVKKLKKKFMEKKGEFERTQKMLSEHSERLKKDFGSVVGSIENTINDISSQIEELERKSGASEVTIEGLKTKVKEQESELEHIMKTKSKNEKEAKSYHKAKEMLDMMIKLKKNVVSRVREIVLEKTNDNFRTLCWKKDFDQINILDDYELEVLDRKGLNIFGSLSTGERKILGLSFLGALSTISGFNVPIFIDNPFGMLDKQVQKNVAERLKNYLPGKQLFLFSLDSHVSDEVGDILKREKDKIQIFSLNYSNEITNVKVGGKS